MEDFAELTEVACSMAPWVDRVEDHDPKWHEFGALRHTLRAFQNARRIKALIGIDVVRLVLWHDIGKFIPGVRQEKEGKPGKFRFRGHEGQSVHWLKHNGPDFKDDELFLIAKHGIIRGDSTVEDIVELCKGNDKLLKELVLLCAADISGKGSTDSQKQERELLAPKFYELALRAGFEKRVAILIRKIVLTW